MHDPLQIAIKALNSITTNGDALSGDECKEIAEDALKQIRALIDCPSAPNCACYTCPDAVPLAS